MVEKEEEKAIISMDSQVSLCFEQQLKQSPESYVIPSFKNGQASIDYLNLIHYIYNWNTVFKEKNLLCDPPYIHSASVKRIRLVCPIWLPYDYDHQISSSCSMKIYKLYAKHKSIEDKILFKSTTMKNLQTITSAFV